MPGMHKKRVAPEPLLPVCVYPVSKYIRAEVELLTLPPTLYIVHLQTIAF